MSMVVNSNVSDALDSSLRSLIAVSAERVDPGKGMQIFSELFDERAFIKMSSLHAEGSFQKYRKGEDTPMQNVFQGAPLTVYPETLGGKRSFNFKTVEEVQAAMNGDLQTLTDNWMSQYASSRDKQCATRIKSTANGYDGVALFSASHRQLSRAQAGETYSNLDDTAEAISPDVVRAALKGMTETAAYDESGEPIDNEATHLVVHDFDDEHELKAILMSEKRAGVANNDKNTLADLGLLPMRWRRLAPASGTTRYLYAFNTKRGENGLFYWTKSPLSPLVWFDNDKRHYLASAEYEGVAECFNWRSAYRKKLVA
jgi:hypothetical protein